METIADYRDQCGECPVWDAAGGVLYWTDCVGLRFYRYDPSKDRHQIANEGLEINGFRFNRSGGFVITNNSGIWLWDGCERPRLIAGEVDGIKCAVNDCVADARGRLFTGTWFYNPEREYPLGNLLCVDTNGRVNVLDEGIHLANGLGFSPDEATLYFTDSVARTIYRYDYRAATGNVRNRRVFAKVPDDEGLPDGLSVDAEGYVWSAQWYGSTVVRYDPDGKVERRIATPAKQTSCLTFGGRDLDELYITTAARSEPMPVMPPGYDAKSGVFGGALYRTKPGITGRPAAMADIAPVF